MSDYVISCCSTADLKKEHFEARDIKYIYSHYQMDDVPYPDDLGQTMPFDKFYQAMRDGADTKTSQINADEFEEYFEPFLKEGKDILHVCLSSGITGVVNSANIAKSILEEKYPERTIYIVDSLTASSGYGLLVDTMADLRDGGMGIDDLYKWADEHKLNVQTWFFTSDLTFFVKGGRVSRTSGFVGNMLNICPLLNMDVEGHLIPRFKIRTKRKVIEAIVKQMEEHADDGLEYGGKVYLSNSDCYDDAKAVADLIESKFPKLAQKPLINDIGTTIGSHTGPGTVALFFWGDKRVD